MSPDVVIQILSRNLQNAKDTIERTVKVFKVSNVRVLPADTLYRTINDISTLSVKSGKISVREYTIWVGCARPVGIASGGIQSATSCLVIISLYLRRYSTRSSCVASIGMGT